jgi:hypothetical protein
LHWAASPSYAFGRLSTQHDQARSVFKYVRDVSSEGKPREISRERCSDNQGFNFSRYGLGHDGRAHFTSLHHVGVKFVFGKPYNLFGAAQDIFALGRRWPDLRVDRQTSIYLNYIQHVKAASGSSDQSRGVRQNSLV